MEILGILVCSKSEQIRWRTRSLQKEQVVARSMSFRCLHETMMAFDCMRVERNPVAIGGDGIDLIYILEQYSLFPKSIVSMLTLAKKHAEEWKMYGVIQELDRNIGQELGSDSGSTTHYQMLTDAMRREFEVNLWGVHGYHATHSFIDMVFLRLSDANIYISMGAIYALECTAVPELRVVLELVNRLAKGRELLPETKLFFDKHLGDWEPSHESELRTALVSYLDTAGARRSFQSGFIAVLKCMEQWWQSLAKEGQAA